MTQKEYLNHVAAINRLSHEEMVRIHRFAPSEHVYFEKKIGLWKVFSERLKKLGGINPEISKKVGWEP